jgi:hypothetical protein
VSTGAANRRKGHDAERELAAYLRRWGWTDAETTRNADGGDRHPQPLGDIANVPGLIIEVRHRHKSDIGGWLHDLGDCAPRTGLVVVRPYRQPDPGRWWAVQYLEHWLDGWTAGG